MITAQASNSAYEVSEQGITAMIFFFRQEGIEYSIRTNHHSTPSPDLKWIKKKKKKHYIYCLHNIYYRFGKFSIAVTYPEGA